MSWNPIIFSVMFFVGLGMLPVWVHLGVRLIERHEAKQVNKRKEWK